MKPIEIHPATHSRPVGADAARAVSAAPARPGAGTASSPAGPGTAFLPAGPGTAFLPVGPGTASLPEPEMVSRSGALSAGSAPPVDADRVAQIRSAIKDGSYPLVPTSVADAMIAAGYILIEGPKDR